MYHTLSLTVWTHTHAHTNTRTHEHTLRHLHIHTSVLHVVFRTSSATPRASHCSTTRERDTKTHDFANTATLQTVCFTHCTHQFLTHRCETGNAVLKISRAKKTPKRRIKKHTHNELKKEHQLLPTMSSPSPHPKPQPQRRQFRCPRCTVRKFRTPRDLAAHILCKHGRVTLYKRVPSSTTTTTAATAANVRSLSTRCNYNDDTESVTLSSSIVATSSSSPIRKRTRTRASSSSSQSLSPHCKNQGAESPSDVIHAATEPSETYFEKYSNVPETRNIPHSLTVSTTKSPPPRALLESVPYQKPLILDFAQGLF